MAVEPFTAWIPIKQIKKQNKNKNKNNNPTGINVLPVIGYYLLLDFRELFRYIEVVLSNRV